MSTRSRRKGPNRSQVGSSSVPLYIALALLAFAAVTLVFLALSGVHIGSRPTTVPFPDSTATSAPMTNPTPTASASLTSISFAGDWSSQWWVESIGADRVPGIVPGPVVGSQGMNTAELMAELDQAVVSPGQPVVVQAGTQDIIEGATNADIDVAVKSLWQAVRDRGGQPIAALIPPSNLFPGAVITVNNQIRISALREGVKVLDVTTAIMSVDGTWIPGLSDDGQQPNGLGIAVLSDVVVGQLPDLVSPNAANE